MSDLTHDEIVSQLNKEERKTYQRELAKAWVGTMSYDQMKEFIISECVKGMNEDDGEFEDFATTWNFMAREYLSTIGINL